MAGYILGGLAAAGGYLSNTPEARTGTQASSGTNSTTSRSRRVLTPGQEDLNALLTKTATDRITNPAAGLEPIREANREEINTRFASLPDILREKYGGTGYGSGKLGTAQRVGEVERLRALGGADSDFRRLILQMQESGIGLADRLLSQNFESENTADQNFSNNGTYMTPGSAVGGAIAAGGGTIAQQIGLLSQMMAINGGLK